MTLPHELDCLPHMQKAPDSYLRIACPPQAQSLPLMTRSIGMSRWQLCGKVNLKRDVRLQGAMSQSGPKPKCRDVRDLAAIGW